MKSERVWTITLGTIASVALLLLATTWVYAGSRPAEVVALWMEPAGGDEAQTKAEKAAVRKCRRAMLDALREPIGGEDTNITKGNRKKIAKRLKLDVATFDATWAEISDKVYKRGFTKPLRGDEDYREDSVMLIECNPKDKLIRAVVHSPSGDVFRFRFQHVELTKKFVLSVGETILYQSMVGFEL